ncbi:DUF3290 domain-containing protein [Lachnoanaerobaculum orale]|uniref:DUF3290 domain-containing protein n=1 Tax=Lachnoanaerobaculum orale TaxID=979627 RepID=A0A3P3Q3N6_9FIRM|nr:DUF3290 domain-containing protein [Lachnoanaerobaculum orale]MBF1009770.1 DUF3290 domain-containing protein [Lachnoanaerobaculum sp.]MDU5597519.1 DUF3290 domain-containing protein [Lachnospiraceae bacterium]RRJ15648.1 DUF3290 domain-containing protein [Lachnoanaerobaculum orale]
MNFYTLDYITKTQSNGLIIRSAIIIVLLAIVILTSFKFMKDRMKTKLRDISIGIVVLTFILLGIQVEHYTQNNRDFSQSHVLLKFIESVATDYKVSPYNVMVNSTTLKDGIIVRYNDEDYTVHLNADNNSYTLERTHIINHNVYVDGEK